MKILFRFTSLSLHSVEDTYAEPTLRLIPMIKVDVQTDRQIDRQVYIDIERDR